MRLVGRGSGRALTGLFLNCAPGGVVLAGYMDEGGDFRVDTDHDCCNGGFIKRRSVLLNNVEFGGDV